MSPDRVEPPGDDRGDCGSEAHPGETLGQEDALRVPRYASGGTFARLPRSDQVQGFDVAIVGVPYDAGVTYRPGARFGPSHIRQASRLLRPFHSPLDVLPFEAIQVVDAGDIVATPFDIARAVEQIESEASQLLQRTSYVLALGGDHSIALPLLRAIAGRHGPVALVHFDAHLDTWDSYFGEQYTHGTPFRRAHEEGLFSPGQAVHVGIRGPLYSRTDLSDDRELGFRVIFADEYDSLSANEVAARIQGAISDSPTYFSIDIDVLDPAFAPATGTPEAGGLTTRELLATLRALVGANIVGADIVEVSPPYDHAEITGIAASHAAFELIALMAGHASASGPRGRKS